MAAAKNVVRRALLYGMRFISDLHRERCLVATSPWIFTKNARQNSGLNADCVAYDLEDSVTPGRKAEARSNIRRFLEQPRISGVKECAVRINAVGSNYAADDILQVANAPNLDTIVIPKVNSGADLQWAADFINHNRTYAGLEATSPHRVKILALIESAKALSSLSEICSTATSQLDGLIFAAEDFALDLSLTRTPSLTEFLYARSAIATACRAHNLSSTIDLVCTSYKGEEGIKTMEEECLSGKGLGFNGKQCIHPDQVPIAQKAFAPSEDEATWAVRIAIADAKADKQGRGAWTLDSKMIDAPVVGKAKRLVSRAEACGIDVNALRERWKDQEPE